MDPSIITGLAALAGAAIGGFTSLVAAWLSQRQQQRAERLAHYQMLPEMGPPPTTIWEYPMADDSWQSEFQDFLEDIRLGRQPDPGIAAAQAALRVVETVYTRAEKRLSNFA